MSGCENMFDTEEYAMIFIFFDYMFCVTLHSLTDAMYCNLAVSENLDLAIVWQNAYSGQHCHDFCSG